MILQIIRRGVQLGAWALLCGIALLSLYAHYRSARVIDDPQLMAGMRGAVVCQAVHPFVDKLDDPQAFLDANKGTLWSMRLFGLSITDPLAAAEAIAATGGVHWPLVASIVIPVVLTIIFGRVFCSWICPAYLLFEITGKLRKLLRLADLEPRPIRFSPRNKYVFLLVGLGLTAVAATPIFALVYPPAVVSRVVHAWIFGTAMTAMLVMLGAVVAFELLVSPRWWCRTMCPGGALYALLGWVRPVRVRLKSELCTGCKDCIPVCEAGINPITQSASIECDNCGVCLRHCDHQALYYTIGLPDAARRRNASPAATKRPITAGLIAAAALLTAASPAAGHHILGLPHYSYKENYPQRPTLEYPATTGPYDVLLTSYPGVPNPGEPANLAFYIRNRDTGAAFAEPVTVRILRTSTFGDNTVILPSTTRPPFENQFKFHATFPDDGEYVVELSLSVEGRVEVIPFLMVVGEPTAAASFAAAGSALAVFGFVVFRAIQKKRRRRLRSEAVSPAPATGGALS